MRRLNLFARGVRRFESGLKASLTASYIDGEKGIAPEGHKDPETSSSIRYWRYPDWKNLMLIASVGAERDTDRAIGYRLSGWVNRFDQSIVSYESVSYTNPEARQDDEDLTTGARAILQHAIGESELRVSASGTYANHRQIEREDASTLDQTFKQLLGSAGVELDVRPGGRVWYSGSLNLDMQAITDADVFEAPDPSTQLGGMIGAVLQANVDWAIRASVGRKSRFPTMRERYSGALGRFVVNPDLSAEKAFLGELGARFLRGSSSFEITGFTNLTTDTIDQDVTEVDGETKRIRVNLGGSRSFGLEASLGISPLPGLTIDANGMVNYLRAEDPESGEYDRRLTERPVGLASVGFTYNHRKGANGSLSLAYTGEAYSLDDTGEFVSLSPSTVLNGRAGYRFEMANARLAVEIFARVNNVFDVLVENQLGLPGPGRMVLGGVKIGG
jgi:iron complex outermembrane receptor protein